MRLNVRALAFAMGAVWGVTLFLVGGANWLWPGYGKEFLALASSLYPGFHVGGLAGVLVGALYATLDGAVGGLALAWLYNRFLPRAASRG